MRVLQVRTITIFTHLLRSVTCVTLCVEAGIVEVCHSIANYRMNKKDVVYTSKTSHHSYLIIVGCTHMQKWMSGAYRYKPMLLFTTANFEANILLILNLQVIFLYLRGGDFTGN